MSSHFKWYPANEEVVVPWNARYIFPTQANKAVKITPRIPPKNGMTFLPGNVIRIEFPAQGYVNPINTTLEFDVTLQSYATAGGEIVRFQNNIQSIFSRVRLLYGSTPLEDMINYDVIVRALTEWTATNQNNTIDQTSIAEGIGGITWGADGSINQGVINVRQNLIQGIDESNAAAGGASITGGNGVGIVPNQVLGAGLVNQTGASNRYSTRRYQVNLALGILTQDKLIPTKFMASQLAIEITLNQPSSCIFALQGAAVPPNPTYGVTNVNLIPEILEFDASYDAMFLKGLQKGGVPIKFSSWHTFTFSTGGGSSASPLIQERSRSVKALFVVQRRNPPSINNDSGALLYDTAATGGSTMQNYQFRIGGRYFPASPVQLSTTVGSNVSNGGAEAFVELQKALNVVGDYRLSSSVNILRWAVGPSSNLIDATYFNEQDYTASQTIYSSKTNPNGNPTYLNVTVPSATAGNSFAGNVGSNAYASAIDLETSNGLEISGLNAEEQSDISFIANWSGAQTTGFSLEAYTYYDAMIILRENNVLELIQ